MLLKYREKDNGRTSCEDMRGHRVKHSVAGFGERVLFRLAPDSRRNKFDGEWMQGGVVGVMTRTSEYIILKDGVVHKCPTMRRRTAAEAYDENCLKELEVKHYDYIMGGGGHSQATYISWWT